MNLYAVFEQKLREKSFDSLEKCQSELLALPLAGHYILELLVARGVLEITAEGGVAGVKQEDKKGARGRGTASKLTGSWGSTWPDRTALLNVINSAPDGLVLRDIKIGLEAAGIKVGHWMCVNSVKQLMRQGAIMKVGLTYMKAGGPAAVPASAAAPRPLEDAKMAIQQFNEVLEAAPEGMLDLMIDVGAPFEAAKVNAALLADKDGAAWLEKTGFVKGFSQAFINYAMGVKS